MRPKSWVSWLVVLLALAVATWQRVRAVERLPPDYDELVYLPVAYRYAERMTPGRWGEVPGLPDNAEHPPGVKLLFAAELRAARLPEPDWTLTRVGRPIPASARPAFTLTRALSAGAGIAQVALVGCVHPGAALLLALDTYHAKYTAQAYLEAIPGLLAVLAVLAFERARRAGAAFRLGPLALSGGLLGLATAGKYPHGLVLALALGPFLLEREGRRARVWAAFVLPALGAFLAADPALWSSPLAGLASSLAFHWGFAQGEHVTRAALPWYQPLYHLTHATPVRWHPDVFLTGATSWVLLPLAAVGLPATCRARPVWAAWSLAGLVFLVLWPTKWAQYLLLVLPALCVCAGQGMSTLRGFRPSRGLRRSPELHV